VEKAETGFYNFLGGEGDEKKSFGSMHGVLVDGCVRDHGIPLQRTSAGDQTKILGHMATDAPLDQIDGRVGPGC
jgi:hypothetical protein